MAPSPHQIPSDDEEELLARSGRWALRPSRRRRPRQQHPPAATWRSSGEGVVAGAPGVRGECRLSRQCLAISQQRALPLRLMHMSTRLPTHRQRRCVLWQQRRALSLDALPDLPLGGDREQQRRRRRRQQQWRRRHPQRGLPTPWHQSAQTRCPGDGRARLHLAPPPPPPLGTTHPNPLPDPSRLVPDAPLDPPLAWRHDPAPPPAWPPLPCGCLCSQPGRAAPLPPRCKARPGQAVPLQVPRGA